MQVASGGGEGEGASVCCVVVLAIQYVLQHAITPPQGKGGEIERRVPGIAASIRTIIGVAGLSRSS